jgi:hypothetical protein
MGMNDGLVNGGGESSFATVKGPQTEGAHVLE